MTYQERKKIEEFTRNAEKTAKTQPVQMVKQAIKYIDEIFSYVDRLERDSHV